MIVCGLPTSASASSPPEVEARALLSAFDDVSTSFSAATEVAVAAAHDHEQGADQVALPERPARRGRPRVRRLRQAARRGPTRVRPSRLDEVDERLAVALERVDRDPLLGAVVAAARRAELDRGDAGLEERDGVGRAVAAHGDAVDEPVLRPASASMRT